MIVFLIHSLRCNANDLQCVVSVLSVELRRFTNDHYRMIQQKFGES